MADEKEDNEVTPTMFACPLEEWLQTDSATQCSNDDVSSVRALRHIINSPHKGSYVYLGGRIFQYAIQPEADHRLGLRVTLREPGKNPFAFRIHAPTMFGFEMKFLAAARSTILAQISTNSRTVPGGTTVTTFLFNLKKGEATSVSGLPEIEEAHSSNTREYFLYREYTIPSVVTALSHETAAITHHQLSAFKDWPAVIALDPRPGKEHTITYIISVEQPWKHGAEGYVAVYDMLKRMYNIVSNELVSSEAFRYSSNGDYIVTHKKFPTSFLLMSSDDFSVLHCLDYVRYCPFVDLPFSFPPKVGALFSVELLSRIAAAKVIVRAEGLKGMSLREESCYLIIPIVPLRGEKLTVVHLSISDPMKASEVEIHDFKPEPDPPEKQEEEEGASEAEIVKEEQRPVSDDSSAKEVREDPQPPKDNDFSKEPNTTDEVNGVTSETKPAVISENLKDLPGTSESVESTDMIQAKQLPEEAQSSNQLESETKESRPTANGAEPPTTEGDMTNTMIIEMLQDKVGQRDPIQSPGEADSKEQQINEDPVASTQPPAEEHMTNTQIIELLQGGGSSGTDDAFADTVQEPIVDDGSHIFVTKEVIEVTLPLPEAQAQTLLTMEKDITVEEVAAVKRADMEERADVEDRADAEEGAEGEESADVEEGADVEETVDVEERAGAEGEVPERLEEQNEELSQKATSGDEPTIEGLDDAQMDTDSHHQVEDNEQSSESENTITDDQDTPFSDENQEVDQEREEMNVQEEWTDDHGDTTDNVHTDDVDAGEIDEKNDTVESNDYSTQSMDKLNGQINDRDEQPPTDSDMRRVTSQKWTVPEDGDQGEGVLKPQSEDLEETLQSEKSNESDQEIFEEWTVEETVEVPISNVGEKLQPYPGNEEQADASGDESKLIDAPESSDTTWYEVTGREETADIVSSSVETADILESKNHVQNPFQSDISAQESYQISVMQTDGTDLVRGDYSEDVNFNGADDTPLGQHIQESREVEMGTEKTAEEGICMSTEESHTDSPDGDEEEMLVLEEWTVDEVVPVSGEQEFLTIKETGENSTGEETSHPQTEGSNRDSDQQSEEEMAVLEEWTEDTPSLPRLEEQGASTSFVSEIGVQEDRTAEEDNQSDRSESGDSSGSEMMLLEEWTEETIVTVNSIGVAATEEEAQQVVDKNENIVVKKTVKTAHLKIDQ